MYSLAIILSLLHAQYALPTLGTPQGSNATSAPSYRPLVLKVGTPLVLRVGTPFVVKG